MLIHSPETSSIH